MAQVGWLTRVSHTMLLLRRIYFHLSGHDGMLKMGNTVYPNIIGINDICVEINLGSRLVLKDIRHIPDLQYNLLSSDNKRLHSFFGGGQYKSTHGSFIVAKGKRCYSLY